MKRHPALIPLSHEHHEGLILARLIQHNAPHYKGLPTDVAGKADYALKFYRNSLVAHFSREEKILPLVHRSNARLDEMLGRMLKEHRLLHDLFEDLQVGINLADQLNILGKTLENHIRFEERELFPRMQDELSEETLDEIQALLR